MSKDSTQDKGVRWLNSIEPSTFLGPYGQLEYFTSKHGERIASYYWPAHGEAKAVIQLIQGHGAYVCYDFLKLQGPGKHQLYQGSWIEEWNKSGYSVCGIDLHGLGRSSGLRGYTADFQHYVDETLQFTSIVKSTQVPKFASLPVFAVGGSLGGCIAATAAIQDKTAFTGLALLAPMLSLERLSRQGINRFLRPLAGLLSWLVPTAPLAAVAKNTKYPYLQQCYEADPATCSGNSRIRNAACYLQATDWIMSHLEDVSLPLITFHSENDTMTDPDGSKALVARAGSADKQLRLVNHMWHILTKEDGNEVVRDEIAAWMADRCR